MRTTTPILLGLTMLLAACGGDKEKAADSTAMMAETMPAMDPNMNDMAQHTMMASMNNSGATADVTLTAVGEQSTVAVNLKGAPASASLQQHIHSGTCEVQGAVVAPLDPITTDASGMGMVTTTVTIPKATIANGQHYIQIHGADGKPIACGNVAMHTM